MRSCDQKKNDRPESNQYAAHKKYILNYFCLRIFSTGNEIQLL